MYVRIIERTPTLRERWISACLARFFAEAVFATVLNRLEKRARRLPVLQQFVNQIRCFSNKLARK
jgi:hypothetical protein